MPESSRDGSAKALGTDEKSQAGDFGRSILTGLKPENDEESWAKIVFVLSRAVTPSRFSLLFLVACWLLLRFVYVKAGATLDVGQLVDFASSIFSIVIVFYVVLILLKFVLFIALMRHETDCIVPWALFGMIVLFCFISFDGYMLAGASIYSLASESTTAAVVNLKFLLEDYKFIPAAPVVVAIFASVIPWNAMPKIQALDLPFVASACIGVTVLGFYSFFWKFLPKHLSLGGILFGAVGAGVLIFYIATPAAQTPDAHGKLLIRVMVTILLTCVLLAVYMDYWKKAAQQFWVSSMADRKESEDARESAAARYLNAEPGNHADETEAADAQTRKSTATASAYVRISTGSDIGLLQRAANRDQRLTFLPPGHVEVGLWLFFGLVVVGDALGGH